MDKCITTEELAAGNENISLTVSSAVSKRLVTGNNIRNLTKIYSQGYDGNGEQISSHYTQTDIYMTNSFDKPCYSRQLPATNVSILHEQSCVEPWPNETTPLEANRVWAHLYDEDMWDVDVVAIKCENPGNAYLQLESYGRTTAITSDASWNFMISGTSSDNVEISQAALNTLSSRSIIMPRLQYSKNGVTWENCERVESVLVDIPSLTDGTKRCERRTKIYFKDCIDNTIYLSNFIYNTSYRLMFSSDASTATTGARCSILSFKDMDNGGDAVKHVTVAGQLLALTGNGEDFDKSNVGNYTYFTSILAHLFQETNQNYMNGAIYDLEIKDGLLMPLSNGRACLKMFAFSPIKQPAQFYWSPHTTMGGSFCQYMYYACENLDKRIRSPFPKDLRFQGTSSPAPFMLGARCCYSMFSYSNITESDYWYVDIDLSNSAITYAFRWCFQTCLSLAKVPRMYVLEKDSAFPASISASNTFQGMLLECTNVKEIWVLRDPPVLSNSGWTSSYLNWWSTDAGSRPTSCTIEDSDFASKNFRFFTRGLFYTNSNRNAVRTNNIWQFNAGTNPNNFGPGKSCTYPENTYFFETAWGYTVKKVLVNFDPQSRTTGVFPNHALFCWTIYNGVPTRKFIIYGATTAISTYTIEIAVTLSRGNIAPYRFENSYLDPSQNYWPVAMWAIKYHNDSAYRPSNENGHLNNSALPDGTRVHDHVNYDNSQIFISSEINKASSSLTMDYSIQNLDVGGQNIVFLDARRITNDTNKVVPFRIGWGHEYFSTLSFNLRQNAFLDNKNDIILFERRVISSAITGYTAINAVKVHSEVLNGSRVNSAFKLPYKPNTTSRHGFEITFAVRNQNEYIDPNSQNLGFNLFGVYNSNGYTNWRFYRSSDNAMDGLVYFVYVSSSKNHYINAGYYDLSLGAQTIKFVNGTFYPANGGEPITDLPQMRSGSYYSNGIGVGQLLSGQTNSFYNAPLPKDEYIAISHLAFYDGENRLYDLYPVKRNSDSVVGFYDIINNQFYSSTTGVPFEESAINGNNT